LRAALHAPDMQSWHASLRASFVVAVRGAVVAGVVVVAIRIEVFENGREMIAFQVLLGILGVKYGYYH
jgi:hypothetical protein